MTAAGAGRAAGELLAPVTGFIAKLRHARMFHPDGVMYAATVTPVETEADLRAAGERLAGPAMARLSSAWWRGEKQWPDVLGMAVRFTGRRGGDQDLLLATIRFPWTTPLAPLGTRVTSYTWNHFHAVSPFEIEGVASRVKLRLRSPRLANDSGLSRVEHLRWLVSEGLARWVVEARRLSRFPLFRAWEPVAELRLVAPIDVDQAGLRFSPFNAGRGLEPVGFVHHLRIGTYAASQRARL